MPPSNTTMTLTPGDDVAAAKDLVAWAKTSGVTLTIVKVGAVELHIAPDVRAPNVTLPATPATNLYEQYGGDALAELTKLQQQDVDDDDQPAVQA